VGSLAAAKYGYFGLKASRVLQMNEQANFQSRDPGRHPNFSKLLSKNKPKPIFRYAIEKTGTNRLCRPATEGFLASLRLCARPFLPSREQPNEKTKPISKPPGDASSVVKESFGTRRSA
jgi:hypothetical protein